MDEFDRMILRHNGIMVRSRVYGQLIDVRTGRIVQVGTTRNLVTNVGEQMLAYLLRGDQSTKGYVAYMSLCDSEDAPAETDTTEVGANNGPRKSVGSPGVVGNKVTFEGLWLEDEANYTIRRCYLFTAASSGYLFATAAFDSPFTKTSDFTFTATWEETFEQT